MDPSWPQDGPKDQWQMPTMASTIVNRITITNMSTILIMFTTMMRVLMIVLMVALLNSVYDCYDDAPSSCYRYHQR